MNNSIKLGGLVLVIFMVLGMILLIMLYTPENRLEDPAADFAMKWSEKVDLNIQSGKADAAGADKWFKKFSEERKSLGAILKRDFRSSQDIIQNNVYYTRAVFNSSFANAREISEIILIGQDENEAFKIFEIKYQYLRIPVLSDAKYTVKTPIPEQAEILKVTGDYAEKIEAARLKYKDAMEKDHNMQEETEPHNPVSFEGGFFWRRYNGSIEKRTLDKMLYCKNSPGVFSLELAMVVNKITIKGDDGKDITAFEFIGLQKDNTQEKPQWDAYHYRIRSSDRLEYRRRRSGVRPGDRNTWSRRSRRQPPPEQ